jgi:hypothetical protein
MTGREYADLIAAYIVKTYGARGLAVYREITLGKTIIAKNRRVDVFVLHEPTSVALAVECKYQEGPGTVDEKIPYALEDLAALPVPGVICYAGGGFSTGVVHMLEASPKAARCLPAAELAPSTDTWELDHVLAITFRWWDVLLKGRVPVTLPLPPSSIE